MKKIILVITLFAIAFLFSPQNTWAQTVKKGYVETEIAVKGNCGSCKNRIETAAYSIKGVKKALWSADKQTLLVKFKPSKTNQQTIAEAVSAAGYDSSLSAATDEVYNKLPACCQYRTGKKCNKSQE